jgi:hypothetical protein
VTDKPVGAGVEDAEGRRRIGADSGVSERAIAEVSVGSGVAEGTIVDVSFGCRVSEGKGAGMLVGTPFSTAQANRVNNSPTQRNNFLIIVLIFPDGERLFRGK